MTRFLLLLLTLCSTLLLGKDVVPLGVISKCSRHGLAALTFDDGITSGSSLILDVLEKNNVRAAFFIIGETLKANNFYVLKRSYDQGHTIGNHTWKHSYLNKMTDEQIEEDVLTTQNGFASVSRQPLKKFFRPPYGANNQRVYDKLVSMGFTVVLWNMDLRDWRAAKTKKQIWDSYKNHISNANPLKDSFIILLHTKEKTAALLPDIIALAKAKGFKLVSLDECISHN